jgi:hypothetical protein
VNKQDIHKIDSWLIRCGWLAFVSLLFTHACTDSFDGANAGTLVFDWRFLAVALGGTFCLTAGYSIRGRANRVFTVWNILEHATEVSVAELQRSTGFSKPFIDKAVRTINRQPGAYYVLDDDNDTIVDGRLRSQVMVVAHCDACGAPVNTRVSLDLPSPPACPHCRGPVLSADMNQLKLERVDALRAQTASKSKFSVLLFVALLFVFWPAAIVYAIWSSGALDSMLKSA